MTAVDSITRLMDWLEDEVCPLVSYKVPGETEDDADYEYKLAHPSVLGMYWPTTKETLPPGVQDVQPGILVQVTSGSESQASLSRAMTVRLHLSVWNPGRHGPDAWRRKTAPDHSGLDWVRDESAAYQPGYDDGWRDAWNLLDTVVREVRNSPVFEGGARVDKSKDIAFGPYEVQENIVDLYPYWFAWVEFTLVEPTTPPVALAEFL